MLSLLPSIRLNLTALLRWWRGELAALIPQPLRRLALWRRQEVWLQLEADRWRLRPAGGPAGVWEPLTAARRARRVLLLPAARCIRREAEFPRSVEGSLAQVLTYELDRLTPLGPERAYYDYRVLERDQPRQRLRVELLLAPRETLDELLAQLAAQGIPPHQVTRLNDAGSALLPFNLLPADRRPRPWRRAGLVNGLLLLLLLLLVAAWLTRPLGAIEGQVERLQPQLQQAQAAAEATQALQRRLDVLVQSRSFLADKRRQRMSSLELLRELTLILPDDTWLQQLQLRDDGVLLQGQAPAAARVVQLLESSPLLVQVSFRSPVVRDPRSGKESFYLAARWRGPEP